ncbi:MAG: hypothetical protein MUC47_09670 [Candidatus Kapabacteria bacterium]|nr:hypothetical protein [Candidatus Kapabacteria bacterium]
MSVLVAESITKAYPRAGRVVNNVSLDVHQGELIALVGQGSFADDRRYIVNGAGTISHAKRCSQI